jgi:hypothetical protein
MNSKYCNIYDYWLYYSHFKKNTLCHYLKRKIEKIGANQLTMINLTNLTIYFYIYSKKLKIEKSIYEYTIKIINWLSINVYRTEVSFDTA